MITREITPHLIRLFAQYPFVTVTGPRQSGKTTLCRVAFPALRYVNLEAPNQREFAASDPLGFLGQLGDGAILDEIQRVPELLVLFAGSGGRTGTKRSLCLDGQRAVRAFRRHRTIARRPDGTAPPAAVFLSREAANGCRGEHRRDSVFRLLPAHSRPEAGTPAPDARRPIGCERPSPAIRDVLAAQQAKYATWSGWPARIVRQVATVSSPRLENGAVRPRRRHRGYRQRPVAAMAVGSRSEQWRLAAYRRVHAYIRKRFVTVGPTRTSATFGWQNHLPRSS